MYVSVPFSVTGTGLTDLVIVRTGVYLIKKDQGLCLKSMVYFSLMVRVILDMVLKFQLENLAKLLLEMTLKSVLKAQ